MQFDHVRGKRGDLITADYRQKSLAGGSRSINAYAGQPWNVLIAELLKCDVVCANCHCRRTVKRRRDEAAMKDLIRRAKGIDD